MRDLPSLRPGCIVLWSDTFGRFHTAMVVQSNDMMTYHELTIVKDDRVACLYLYHHDHDSTWRVLNGT